jgi:anti-sigma factor RsiW
LIRINHKIQHWRLRQRLAPYLDGELAPDQRAKFAAHLEDCKSCRAAIEEQQFAKQLISSFELPAAVPTPLPIWLKANLPAPAPPQPRRPRLIWAAAAVGVAIFIGLFVWSARRPTTTAWRVTRLAGAPQIIRAGALQSIGRTEQLNEGDWIETDSRSRVMIEVGLIGQVELDQRSRARIVTTGPNEQRLELERGRMHASILAPPRQFVVETPAALAVDLGCAYSLEVDEAGMTLLRVASGWVALEYGGRLSYVPAGAVCEARNSGQPGSRLGTPYFEDANKLFLAGLAQFDAGEKEGESLSMLLREARPRDALTVWHLLTRTDGNARASVYARLAALVPLPAGVTREGTLNLDRTMLNEWRTAIEYTLAGIDPQAVATAPGHLETLGGMLTPRHSHTATKLLDGRVLIAGGREFSSALGSAEIYDPQKRIFTEAGRLRLGRLGHEATMLKDGRLLITGGLDANISVTASAEIYDPRTGAFSLAGTMKWPRFGHRATLLRDGRVLITGGLGPDWPQTARAEIYDPQTGTFTAIESLKVARADHTATLLKDGRVLLAGGSSGPRMSSDVVASAEIFDPSSERFISTEAMNVPRHKHSATLINEGHVLIIGGISATTWSSGGNASAEIFDPAAGSFTSTGSMSLPRYKIRDAVVRLPTGQVLVAGGAGRVEIYDPVTTRFSTVAGAIGVPRYYATATLLDNGEVLITGGYSDGMLANASAWIYRPEK